MFDANVVKRQPFHIAQTHCQLYIKSFLPVFTSKQNASTMRGVAPHKSDENFFILKLYNLTDIFSS